MDSECCSNFIVSDFLYSVSMFTYHCLSVLSRPSLYLVKSSPAHNLADTGILSMYHLHVEYRVGFSHLRDLVAVL